MKQPIYFNPNQIKEKWKGNSSQDYNQIAVQVDNAGDMCLTLGPMDPKRQDKMGTYESFNPVLRLYGGINGQAYTAMYEIMGASCSRCNVEAIVQEFDLMLVDDAERKNGLELKMTEDELTGSKKYS